MTINREYYSTIFIVGLTLLFGLFYYVDAPLILRVPVGLLFLVLVPGYSIIQLINLKDNVQKIVLSLALSIALETIIAWLVIYSDLWSVNLIVNILILLSLSCAAIYLWTLESLGNLFIQL